MQPLVDEWFPTGALVAPQCSAVANKWAASLHDLKVLLLAPGTWRSYTPTWRRMWRWCMPHLATITVPSVRSLHRHEQVLEAYLTKVFQESRAPSALPHAVKVANFAFKLHDLPSVAKLPAVKLLKTAGKRLRAKPVRKKIPIERMEITTIQAQWGNEMCAPWQRTMVLAIAMMFDLALRYNDLAQVRIDMLRFEEGRCMIGMATAKNNQGSLPSWLVLADRRSHSCTFSRLVRELRARGYTVPARGFIRTHGARYLWPNLVADGHGGLALVEIDKPRLHGLATAGSAAGYEQFRSLFKVAVKEVLKYPEDVTFFFSTHSMRRGANTLRLMNDASKRQRMDWGRWRSEGAEDGYCEPPADYVAAQIAGSQMS